MYGSKMNNYEPPHRHRTFSGYYANPWPCSLWQATIINRVPSKNLLLETLTSGQLDYLWVVHGRCESSSVLRLRFPRHGPLASQILSTQNDRGCRMDGRTKKRKAGTISLIMGINGIRVCGLKIVENARWSSFSSLSPFPESALNW